MKRIVTMIFVTMFMFVGCATNSVINGKNVGGLVGVSDGAYGESVLCKNCKGVAKVAKFGGSSPSSGNF